MILEVTTREWVTGGGPALPDMAPSFFLRVREERSAPDAGIPGPCHVVKGFRLPFRQLRCVLEAIAAGPAAGPAACPDAKTRAVGSTAFEPARAESSMADNSSRIWSSVTAALPCQARGYRWVHPGYRRGRGLFRMRTESES